MNQKRSSEFFEKLQHPGIILGVRPKTKSPQAIPEVIFRKETAFTKKQI